LKRAAEHIKQVGLVGNAGKAACAGAVRRAARLIQATGRNIFCDEATARIARLDAAALPDFTALSRHVDLLLVFGGDGTMLRMAREIAGSRTPILGINIGGLGFLTAVSSAGLEDALSCIWQGKFKFEERALLQAEAECGARRVRTVALNDLVVSRGSTSRLIDLDVAVDGEPLSRYRCDGLILSSPTGSTAYSLAAGGALIHPTAQVMSLTPICPHTLSNRSLILPNTATVEIRAVNARPATVLSVDGELLRELEQGDTIWVRRSRQTVRLMHLAGSSFYEALRRKLHWRGTNLSDP
jgi:NAD+ kinase